MTVYNTPKTDMRNENSLILMARVKRNIHQYRHLTYYTTQYCYEIIITINVITIIYYSVLNRIYIIQAYITSKR